MDIVEVYNKFSDCKIIKKSNLEEMYEQYHLTEFLLKKYSQKETAKQYRDIDNKHLVKALCKQIPQKSLSIMEQIKFEQEMLGYIEYKNDKIPKHFWIVIDFKTYNNSSKPYLILYRLNDGLTIKTKIKKAKTFDSNPFGLYSILIFEDFSYERKHKQVDGKWVEVEETEPILNAYEVLRKEVM